VTSFGTGLRHSKRRLLEYRLSAGVTSETVSSLEINQ
jgi:hypothetical protein